MYILLAILIFGVMIIVHEFGHFITAKLLDVQVNEFSICMGPAIFQKKIGETTYSLRSIPVGGYCAMEGEDEQIDNPRAFTSKHWLRRFVILIAGASMNFLSGLLILLLLFSSSAGFYDPTIVSFEADCPYASSDGLQVGDRLVSIDGERIYIYSDVSMLLERNSSGIYDFVVQRGGKKVSLPGFAFQKREYTVDGETVLRYGVNFTAKPATLRARLSEAWRTALDFVRLVRLGLSDLIHGAVGVKDMSGPVGIVSTISEVGKQSNGISEAIQNIAYLAAFLSINLAVMNMLPIPALDGGRVFFLLITTLAERVLRRKISPKYEGYIHAAGMVILLAFMALITIEDIVKLI